MKNALSFLLICSIAILGICAFCSLPKDQSGIVKEKYNDWTGVIRIWVQNDIKTNPAQWINTCSTEFERSRKGIYINTQSVSPSAITSFRDTGINPPDIIIWSAGLLDSADSLSEITGEYSLRPGLEQSPYAVPLLTDAYAWIYAGSLPADMQGTPVACSENMLIPMTALSTGLRTGESHETILPGVDLGLSGDIQKAEKPEGNILCRASSALAITEDSAARLKSGDVSAIVGDISMISALCGEGFSAAVTGNFACTGAPVLFSIVEKDVSAAEERRALCEDFLTYLLTEGQEKAHLAGAMPASDNITAHAGDPILSHMEAQLAGLKCISPPYFGSAPANEKIRLFLDGKITADKALAK